VARPQPEAQSNKSFLVPLFFKKAASFLLCGLGQGGDGGADIAAGIGAGEGTGIDHPLAVFRRQIWHHLGNQPGTYTNIGEEGWCAGAINNRTALDQIVSLPEFILLICFGLFAGVCCVFVRQPLISRLVRKIR
jgi:hypothetical protein